MVRNSWGLPIIFSTVDPPGKPGQPRVTDWDADRIDLEWDAPENNGGAPVDSYIVEQYDPTSKEWLKVKEVKDTKASIGGLKEGKEYQFRIRAVNKAGPGEPSKPSEKQIAKPRFGNFYWLIMELVRLILKWWK